MGIGLIGNAGRATDEGFQLLRWGREVRGTVLGKGDRDSWAKVCPDPAFTSRRGFLPPASSPFSYNKHGDSGPQTALNSLSMGIQGPRLPLLYFISSVVGSQPKLSGVTAGSDQKESLVTVLRSYYWKYSGDHIQCWGLKPCTLSHPPPTVNTYTLTCAQELWLRTHCSTLHTSFPPEHGPVAVSSAVYPGIAQHWLCPGQHSWQGLQGDQKL